MTASAAANAADFAASLLGGYTEAELSAAFSRVANKENWKLPIKSLLPSITSHKERAKIAYAIKFYTGSVATFGKAPTGHLLVTAPGYYAAVGA